ncbi:natterin-3-like [Thunnus maccoyii]|uniref:natterin-3-like n=1 Tax=Thunnus maccoyii TaxID=8240 RepID=UPI001C4A7BFD|nr:natterin-3-like [Thunnus maccoyii]XP_042276330.1 natterin-3-like [Thunnus maccoyii]
MKLSFLLLLLALLALSSAIFQDILKQSSQHRKVSLLKPTCQSPPFSSISDCNAKLKWQTWTGSLSDKAVSIYNSYDKRTDYICKFECHAGFYCPYLDSYCHYAYADKEYRDSQFEILVNEDDFEILQWREGSYGSVPPNSIRTCYSDEIYVGKNEYGLGKVHPKHQAFFLAWGGNEYWYKNYEVLTINKDVESEQISNVKYNINEAEIVQYLPETMQSSVITNNECDSVMKTATFSKTSRVERRWDVGSSRMFGIRTTFTAGIPSIVSGSIEISAQVTFQFSEGQTYSEETSRSVSVQLTVPPNHYCETRMVGHKYKINIPFTAQLSRTYRNGEKTRTLITGMYDATDIGEVRMVVERCKPVTNAKRCP